MKLDPPLGTGESYDFVQKYSARPRSRWAADVAMVETTLKAPPKALAERVPLVPMLWTGERVLQHPRRQIPRGPVEGESGTAEHQGEGTKFEYESIYTEDAVEK